MAHLGLLCCWTRRSRNLHILGITSYNTSEVPQNHEKYVSCGCWSIGLTGSRIWYKHLKKIAISYTNGHRRSCTLSKNRESCMWF